MYELLTFFRLFMKIEKNPIFLLIFFRKKNDFKKSRRKSDSFAKKARLSKNANFCQKNRVYFAFIQSECVSEYPKISKNYGRQWNFKPPPLDFQPR